MKYDVSLQQLALYDGYVTQCQWYIHWRVVLFNLMYLKLNFYSQAEKQLSVSIFCMSIPVLFHETIDPLNF